MRLGRHELRPRLTYIADDGQDAIDVRGVDAGKDRGVAAPQEAAGAAHLRRGIAPLHQLLDEGVSVSVRRYDDEELLVGLLRLPLCGQPGGLELFLLFAPPLHPLAYKRPISSQVIVAALKKSVPMRPGRHELEKVMKEFLAAWRASPFTTSSKASRRGSITPCRSRQVICPSVSTPNPFRESPGNGVRI